MTTGQRTFWVGVVCLLIGLFVGLGVADNRTKRLPPTDQRHTSLQSSHPFSSRPGPAKPDIFDEVAAKGAAPNIFDIVAAEQATQGNVRLKGNVIYNVSGRAASVNTPTYRVPAYTTPSYSPPAYKPYIAENGSYFGEISRATDRPKTVHVDGYYRRDGTYVRGHYRSSPRGR